MARAFKLKPVADDAAGHFVVYRFYPIHDGDFRRDEWVTKLSRARYSNVKAKSENKCNFDESGRRDL